MKKTNKENPENGAKESLVMSYEEQKHNHTHRDTINNDKKWKEIIYRRRLLLKGQRTVKECIENLTQQRK